MLEFLNLWGIIWLERLFKTHIYFGRKFQFPIQGWTLRKQNNSTGPGAQQHCSYEDGHASPVMKRRTLFLL